MLLHTLLQLQWKRSCNTLYCFFMDPLNELLNLVSHVINMCRMCFVYLTFDTAQKVVWLCNIRWVGAVSVPKISATYLKFEKKLAWWAVPSYWPTSCTTVFGATAYTAQISMHVLTTVFPGRLIFHSTDVTWLVQSLILQNQTTAFGTMSKARYMKHNLSNWWLETLSVQVY